MTISNAESIQKIASAIVQDKELSNINQVLVLIEQFTSYTSCTGTQSKQILHALIKSLGRIFVKFINSREFIEKKNTLKDANVENLNLFKRHLVKWYERVIDKLATLIGAEESAFPVDVQEAALETLLKFIEEEGKFPFRVQKLTFPVYILEKILQQILGASPKLLESYSKYLTYDDFIHYTVEGLIKILEEIGDQEESRREIVARDVFEIVRNIKLVRPDNLLPEFLKEARQLSVEGSNKAKNDRKVHMRLCPLSKGTPQEFGQKVPFDYVKEAELYAQLWMIFLKSHQDSTTFKKALTYLDKYALQHFANPLVLADFLFDLFSQGGLISLLSMSPLYVVMSRCNVEYPNFYATLYGLLEPAVSYAKYRAQFLFWCDLFLTSTHISSKVVASFAKRLTRLALRSSPDTASVLLPFIGNLFIRHPMICSMLRAAKFEPQNDPFLPEEANPEETRALDSYMWELKALQSHYIPEIVETAKKILEAEQKIEWMLEDTLETTVDDLIEKESARLEKTGRGTYDLDCNVFYSI